MKRNRIRVPVGEETTARTTSKKKTLGLVVVQGGNTQILALVVFARVRARVIVVATREFNQGVGACSRLDVLQLPFFGIIDHKRYPRS